MEPFLLRLAKLLWEQHPHELDRVAVVLPSKRAGIHLRKYLAQVAGRTIWSPDLFDPGGFMERITAWRQGTSMEMLFALYEAHRTLEGNKAEGLAEFMQWAPTAVRDMSEVDAHLLDHAQLYKDLRAYHELEEWSFSGAEELSAGQQRAAAQWTRTGALHAQFLVQMVENRTGTSGAISRHAVELVQAHEWTSPWRAVWFAGLNALDPATTSVIKALQGRDVARIAWDADAYYMSDNIQEAGRYLRRSVEQLGEGLIPIGGSILESERAVEMTTAPNRFAQALHAAAHIARMGPEEREHTALVLADESLLMPLLQALPPSAAPINVTMGLSLNSLPVHGLTESFLDAIGAAK
ncbi:MAG TPA: hypothetical protein PK760_09905, partial [Flavobacteriales bacterium]|nr:hypothetical protein [Flavobacteriales bacterium]